MRPVQRIIEEETRFAVFSQSSHVRGGVFVLTERAEALIRIENLQLHTLSSVFLISAGFQFHILPNQSMKRTEDEQEYRRCSSCKMRLALSMFDESSSSHSYKT